MTSKRADGNGHSRQTAWLRASESPTCGSPHHAAIPLIHGCQCFIHQPSRYKTTSIGMKGGYGENKASGGWQEPDPSSGLSVRTSDFRNKMMVTKVSARADQIDLWTVSYPTMTTMDFAIYENYPDAGARTDTAGGCRLLLPTLLPGLTCGTGIGTGV